ncbi:mycofactocin precursor MftA [Streptomyces boluensis]|uniref:Mycofactocin n=1 Tax=Streptomyces boluensis TaxID=1775135 RepID=A0A964URV8_9ACTN|nr:mycofactocin precursor MftA [Streptomyces boluensis]NBE51857.1 mycofactocin precursor [Streptomyces boluensis]
MQHTTATDEQSRTPQDSAADSAVEPDPVEEELLVEEVSIDGMCGVY